eukprot:15471145-Alexandrium_andersonii.AAC.1
MDRRSRKEVGNRSDRSEQPHVCTRSAWPSAMHLHAATRRALTTYTPQPADYQQRKAMRFECIH